MENHLLLDPALARDLAALTHGLDAPDFGKRVLRAVSHACVLRNFGVFVVADARRPEQVMSLFAGDLGEYRIRRNARESQAQPEYAARLAALLEGAGPDAPPFEIHRPEETDPRWPIYRRSSLLERVSCVSIDKGAVYNVNYYRSMRDGGIGAEEEAALRLLLPLVNALIVVRHKLVGVDRLQAVPRRRRVASLRERKRPGFAALSAREADVLDVLAGGRSVAAVALELGVSENTVRTLRARGYRKLGLASLSELFALLLAEADRA